MEQKAYAHIHMTKKTVTETVTREVEVRNVVLTLTTDEAAALLRLTRVIGGHRTRSGRKHMDAIRDALLEAGTPADLPGRTPGYFELTYTPYGAYLARRGPRGCFRVFGGRWGSRSDELGTLKWFPGSRRLLRI